MCLLPGPREGRQTGLAAGDFTHFLFFFLFQTQPTFQMKTFSLHPIALPGPWFPVSNHINIRSKHIQLSFVGQKWLHVGNFTWLDLVAIWES